MSDPQPPAESSEIHLDLGGPAPEPEAAPDEPRRRRIPNAVLGSAAAVFVLAAAVTTAWTWLPGTESIAERAVRDYLEAVRAGDVETARSMMEPVDGDDGFLVPEALDDRWGINEVAQVEYSENTDGFDAVAEVYTEIEAYDGTRMGERLTVGVDGDRPTITSGTKTAEFYPGFTPGFLEANGARLEVEEGGSTLRLLPGVYTFYGTAPETLEFGMPDILVLGNRLMQLGGDSTTTLFATPWPEVTDAGHELLGETVREHFDACDADPAGAECPFAPPSDADGIEIEPYAAWTVTDYPEAAIVAAAVGESGHELATSRPGTVEVAATIDDPGGGTRETTLSCPLLVDGLYAEFDYEGGVELRVPDQFAFELECRSMVEVG